MSDIDDPPRVGSGDEQARLVLLERVLADASLLHAAFNLLTDGVAQALDVPVALVSLVGRDRQYFVGQTGMPDGAQSGTPMSHSFCQHVVLEGKPLVVDNALEHQPVVDNPAIRDLGVVAYAGQPIVVDGLTLGSFCAIDDLPRGWTEREIAALRAFADLVEFLIEARLTVLGRVLDDAENAHTHDREQNSRLSVYEALANDQVGMLNRRLQRALLPEPSVSSGLETQVLFRAGADRLQMGGDFIDTIANPDGGLHFIIGDVTGNGPEPAALAISLRSAWRALQTVDTDLDGAVRVLDRQAAEAKLYATALLGHIDSGGHLSVISAGHSAPITITDAGAEELFEQTGPMLGLTLGTPQWPLVERDLQGRPLLAYTDGLIEVRLRGSRERYGILRLLRSITQLGPDLERIYDAVVAEAGQPLGDDVALLRIAPKSKA